MVFVLVFFVSFLLVAAGILYRIVGTERYGKNQRDRLQLGAREGAGQRAD